MDDFLSKPFSRAGLANVLHRWSGGSQSSRRMRVAGVVGDNQGMSNDVLNDQALANLRAIATSSNPDAFDRIVESYLKSMPEHLSRLDIAVSNSDAEMIWKVAHGIKSTSANLGAHRLSELLEQMEREGKAGRGSTDLLELIHQEYEQVQAALARELIGEVA